MVMHELKGESLSISVASVGAELKSLKKNENGKEYMWSGEPEFWPRTSPVLFPFVGKLKGQQYTYDGKKYNPPVHGFARDTEFSLSEKTENSLHFIIKDTSETKKVYPFDFEFEIIYKLEGNSLKVTYVVKNTGKEEMFFSLGAHPGFLCPLNEEEKRSDCFIGFAKNETPLDKIVNRFVDMNTGLVTNEYNDYALKDGNLPIADDLFANDALVIEKNQVNKVSLLDADGIPYVTLEMEAPVYGIWSCVKPGAPFICIEPWFGRCDALNFEGGLEDREYQNSLLAGEVFRTQYTITIA